MSEETTKEITLRKPRHLGNLLPHFTSAESQTPHDLDKEYLVRALSHDVGAHLMILEYSFRQYDALAKKLAARTAESKSSSTDHIAPDEANGEYLAVGGRIVLRHDVADTKTHAPHKTQRLRPATPSRHASKTDNLAEAASHVTACIDEMKRFVEELISFAKTGNIDMEPTAVPIAGLVAEVLYEQRGLLEKRDIETVVSSPLPTVFANPMRIKQVLTNLVRNAAIHGCDDGHPMIVIAADMSPNLTSANLTSSNAVAREMTAFYVRDNGRGIPSTECERVFEPGYRVPGNQNEGSGIGLATVKKITTCYGGAVTCESGETGTTFTVILPNA